MDRRQRGHSRPWGIAARAAWVIFGITIVSACAEPSPPPPTQLAFVAQPAQSVTRAEPLSPAIAVEARDAAGRRVASFHGSVALTADDTVTSIFSGSRIVQAVDGVATFSNLTIVEPRSGMKLVARSAGLTPAISSPFEVRAGPGVRLVFTRSPAGARVGAPLSPTILVEVQDAGGYTDRTASHLVTLAFINNPTGATLAGDVAVAAVNGLATFANVTVDQRGQGYNLRATATGLSDAVSASFHVRNAFTAVSAGYFHSCGLESDGAPHCWGDVGLPALASSTVKLASISSGRDRRCGLTSTGSAYCWTGSDAPALLGGGLAFARLAAGYGHSCAVTGAGAAYCWGGNQAGEFGNGTIGSSSETPVAVEGGHVFVEVSAGRLFTCGVTTANAAFCWGDGGQGKLGTGEAGGAAIPKAVAGGLTFASVSAGGFHACALRSTGAAYCWGSNGVGQLGDGSVNEAGQPVAVAGGLSFTSLSAGNRHTCALTADGTAYCWGDNTDGMLGRSGPNSSVPVAVDGGLKFASIRAGRFHTCALATDGETYCWGSNANGQLGVLSGGGATPVRVP